MKSVYKIRRKTDGLFSTGGAHPRFNAKGKIWTARNHVTSHIGQVGGYGKKLKDFYSDCDVVLLELVENEIEVVPAMEWKETDKTARAKELEEARQRKYELEALERKRARLMKELSDIGKKLGST
jgi:hypothetical protein